MGRLDHETPDIEDDYNIIKKLGEGAYGTVYKVSPKKSPKQIYALKLIKILDWDTYSNTEKEFKLLQTLGDKCKQGLVCYHKLFYTYYKKEQYIGLLMDYVEGYELFEYILKHCKNRNSDLTSKEIYKIMLHLVKTLKILHDNDLVHRDIKPENIIYNLDQMILIDYGTLCNPKNCDGVVGTAIYLSPELANSYIGKGHMNPDMYKKSDIWALGVTFYFLVNCDFPFGKNDPDKIGLKSFAKYLSSCKIKKSDGPDDYLAEVIDLMLTCNYKERPTIDEILCVLEKY